MTAPGSSLILPLSASEVEDLLDEWVRLGIFPSKEPLTSHHVEKLIGENGCTAKGLALEGRNFQGEDLHDIDLKGANLIGAKLQRANLNGAKLQGAYLMRANLQGADLTLAQLQRATIGQTDFQAADLTLSNLEDAKGFHVKFQRAILRSSNMGRAKLYESQFQCADLQRADLRDADLQHTNLEGADFENAKMKGIKLHGARLDRDTTRFRGADWGEKMLLGEELEGKWGDCEDTGTMVIKTLRASSTIRNGNANASWRNRIDTGARPPNSSFSGYWAATGSIPVG